LVTDERILMVFGAGGDPRRVRWSGSEYNTIWTPSSLNQAGGISIQTNGILLGGVKVRGGILVFTSTDAHLGEYLGPPVVYGFNRIAPNCGPLGINAVIPYEGGAAWMAHKKFWRYMGGRPEEIPCEVTDYVYKYLDMSQASKVYGGHNPSFSELIWFFPGPSGEISHWVLWNYAENHWNVGGGDVACGMARTAWIEQGVFSNPMGVCPVSGALFEHEVGWTANGTPRGEFARSGPIEIGAGERVLSVSQTIPDELTQGDVELRVFTRFTPNGPEYEHGPYPITTPYMDTRFTGRQAAIQIEGVRAADWRVGTMRLLGSPGGAR
jgi:hypothetical protein